MDGGLKYSLTIHSDSPYIIAIIAHIAEIELQEGRIATNPEYLWQFLQTVDKGLVKTGEFSPLTSRFIDDIDTAHWQDVVHYCRSIADKLENILKDDDATP